MAVVKRPNLESSPCEHCGSHEGRGEGGALRCECGSLLARFIHGKLELKCRRCKRTVMVTVEHVSGGDTG